MREIRHAMLRLSKGRKRFYVTIVERLAVDLIFVIFYFVLIVFD